MGLYHEMVCNECNETDDGANSMNTNIIAKLRKQAKDKGWYINKNITLCPKCRKIKGR